MRHLLALLTVTALVTPDVAAQSAAAAVPLGRTLTERLLARDLTLWAAMAPPMRQAMGNDSTRFAAFVSQVASVGERQELLEEQVTPKGGVEEYVQRARFQKASLRFLWAYDASGSIVGLLVRPDAPPEPAPSRYGEYRTRTTLRLPFDGEWQVFWGGRTLAQNYHAAIRAQRFAYDIVGVKDGQRRTGDGTRNEDYACWGRAIVAPGEGTVVAALDSIPDLPPGQVTAAVPQGNHVIVDHGNGEFSLLAHLKRGSVKVTPGQRVRAGDVLGACGNSGNTSEPHLHYQLMDSAAFAAAESMPAQFEGYVADGQPVARGEPVKGQTIRHGGQQAR